MVVLLELLLRLWKGRTCIIMHWSSFLSSLIALMIILDGVSSKAVVVPFLRGLLSVLMLLFLLVCFCFSDAYFVFFRFRWFCSGSNCLGIPALSYNVGNYRAHSNSYIPQHRWKRGTFVISFFLIFIIVVLWKEGKTGNKAALQIYDASKECWRWSEFLCGVICFVCYFLQSDLARVVQSALFVSGINTLIQTFLGSRLPTVMGNSFYFLPVILSIVNSPRIMNIGEPHEVVATTVGSSPVLYNFSFSSLMCHHACVYWICTLLVEVCPRNESDPRGLDRWLSSQHRSRLQWLVEHRHKVWSWCLSEYAISLWIFSCFSLVFWNILKLTVACFIFCSFFIMLGGRFISPIVIAPVTTIVGLGLLEYGFPGVCANLLSSFISVSCSRNSGKRLCGSRALEISCFVIFLKYFQCLIPCYFCAGWQVCWNRYSSTVDYIICLSGESFSLVFSASDMLLVIFFSILSFVFYKNWWLNVISSCSCVFLLFMFSNWAFKIFCTNEVMWWFFLQYLKHFKILHHHIFELFPILFGVAIVWVYATILTVAGTYDHASALGQIHCRTDRSGLVSTAPW